MANLLAYEGIAAPRVCYGPAHDLNLPRIDDASRMAPAESWNTPATLTEPKRGKVGRAPGSAQGEGPQ